jgi:uncharacterized protein (DUF4415 family)
MKRKNFPPISNEEEAEIQREIAENPDTWEATDEELANARPFAEVFPDLAASIKRSRGRPKSDAPRPAVTLRIDPVVVERFKATGPGWRARMAEVLEKAKVS